MQQVRAPILVAALFLGLSAYAQPERDANPGARQNTEGANTDARAMDPATKARVRGEGLAGGTGARVPPEATGGATVGDGQPNRHAPPKPPEPQRAEVRDEKSSDREEGRGARGTIR
jgi:hypothetical protein